MSLNDNVLEGLDEESAIDEDIVFSPDTDWGVEQSIKSDEISTEAYDDLSANLTNFANMDVSLQYVNKNIIKVSELEEIRSEIVAAEAINQTEAGYADDIFGGAITRRISLAEFTRAPSKTNYLIALQCMNGVIIENKRASLESYAGFIEPALQDVNAVVTKIADNYVEAVKEQVLDTRYQLLAFLNGIEQNSDLILPYEGATAHIGNLNIEVLDFTKVQLPAAIPLKKADLEQTAALASNIKNLLKCPRFKAFVLTVIESDQLEITGSESILKYQDEAVTLSHVAKFIASSTLDDYLADLGRLAKDQLRIIETLEKAYADAKGDYDALATSFVKERSSEVQKLFEVTQNLCKVISSTSNLLANAGQLFGLLKQL